jgi:hypothetical protein
MSNAKELDLGNKDVGISEGLSKLEETTQNRRFKTGELAFVELGTEHVSMVFSSWLKSYRNSMFVKNIPSTIYFSEQHKLIQKCIKNGKTIVAVSPEDTEQIIGWINFQVVDGIYCLHYAYVKQLYRGCGVLAALLAESGHTGNAGCYTHDTLLGSRILNRKNLVYHPYILTNY